MTTFNLITGFLGSGKTTLLHHLLSELSQLKRIAVVQNEFAPTGVDGKELQQVNGEFKLLEINNGSVFCVCQLGSFVQQMQRLIVDYKPEIIFLETSGLADPISVVELLQTDELKDMVTLDKNICLVDAPNYFKGMNIVQRFKHQIMIADHIILNKTDLFEGDLQEVVESIRLLNPYAAIISTTYAHIGWTSFCDDQIQKGAAAERYIGVESEGRPDMVACVLRTHEKLAEEGLVAFLKELQQRCPRIKGYLNLKDGRVMLVHGVFHKLELSEIDNYTGPSELVAFGKELTIGELRRTFKRYVA
ncbi:CobW family GTP-binding protein [Saccharicrinis fermentans]|uniref:Putative GTP-binding protein YjiA n=1 Tax=Saccharicrinis fermentans DSM 9555 = JCM 21142 TaxID=869213 RepID=W7Y905_9BACT|nr:CobW family GTP-binding protein [Saccharicrinis fermentans]GAF04757.1 putative GTP-binding protein YjiA [Saccharicrinis fermentans DSM 9555 = JCM 21142]